MSDSKIAELEAKLESVIKRVQYLEDVKGIQEIQYKYGYYIDKTLYEQAVDCFANNPDVRVHFHGGVWKGKEGVRNLYIHRFRDNFTGGKNGPVYGFLLDHPMYQPVVTIDPDGIHAKARLRCNMQAALHVSATHKDPNHRDHEERQWMEGALYENEYIKEDGEWKIQVLKYRPQWHADWTKGVAYTPPEYVPFVKEPKSDKNPTGPDEIETVTLWPDTHVFPFHYPNPDGTWLSEEHKHAGPKVYKEGSTGRIT